MPTSIYAECPCCGKNAETYKDVEEKFGWRNMGEEKRPQSYCRNCRSKHCSVGNKKCN